MKGAAERPVDSGASVESGRDRAPESASFATIRVRSGRRGRPPLFILGFVVLLGAVIAVGVGGKPSPAPIEPVAAVPTATPALTASPSGIAHGRANIPSARIGPAPAVTSEPGPVRVEARRNAGKVYVHLDVYVPRVTWVYVSLLDDAGRVAGWASVSMPGSAGPGQSGGPSLRFDVELAIAEDFPRRLWLSANAYDIDGVLVSSSRLELIAPTLIYFDASPVPAGLGLIHPPPRGPRPSFGGLPSASP